MRRKVQAKARLEKPKPIRIQVDPRQLSTVLKVPKVSYEVVATCEEEDVFQGNVIPIPRVLPYYLKHTEFLVLLVIMEESLHYGECRLSIAKIAARLKITTVSVSGALHSLRTQGLLLEGEYAVEDRKTKVRKVNFETVQHLTDLAEGHDSGVFSRIRKATRKKDILNLTREDVEGAYDHEVLPPDHDPREEEEYN